MRQARFLTPAVLVAALAAPAPALAQGSAPTLTQTVPPFLEGSAPVQTAPQQLPRTGDDLVLQLAAAAGLLGVGLALRIKLG